MFVYLILSSDKFQQPSKADMEKCWDLVTDELDSQPSPPAPDPPDAGHSCNLPQVRTLFLCPSIPLPSPPSLSLLTDKFCFSGFPSSNGV